MRTWMEVSIHGNDGDECWPGSISGGQPPDVSVYDSVWLTARAMQDSSGPVRSRLPVPNEALLKTVLQSLYIHAAVSADRKDIICVLKTASRIVKCVFQRHEPVKCIWNAIFPATECSGYLLAPLYAIQVWGGGTCLTVPVKNKKPQTNQKRSDRTGDQSHISWTKITLFQENLVHNKDMNTMK